MKVCWILVGPSGSGKSTLIDTLLKSSAGGIVFSLDSCRMQFAEGFDEYLGIPLHLEKDRYSAAYHLSMEHEKEFKEYHKEVWEHALTHEYVYVDNTNLTKKSRAPWIQGARAKGFTIIGAEVMAPLSVVLARQATRSDKAVPAARVTEMYMRQQELLLGSECDWLAYFDGSATSPEGMKGYGSVPFHS